jgi:hypothetical protein
MSSLAAPNEKKFLGFIQRRTAISDECAARLLTCISGARYRVLRKLQRTRTTRNLATDTTWACIKSDNIPSASVFDENTRWIFRAFFERKLVGAT